MTKDGRPSRIFDIRYFHGPGMVYLQGHEDAVAHGRRLAMFLNGEGYSLGAYEALYIRLTSDLEPGAVRITEQGAEWWHRFTLVGVPPEFPNLENASDLVMKGTVDALQAIRPDLSATVDAADRTVRMHGNELRFPIKAQQTKRYLVEVSFDVRPWPAASNVYTSLTDMVSGEFLESPPLPITLYSDAFHYNGPIRIRQIEEERATFVRRARPVMSKLVKRRG